MPFDGRSLDDYVDVAQRIADFRELYPSGSLQPADLTHPWEQATVAGVTKQGEPFAATMIVYVAAAYRTPDDQRPGIGVAWEPFPGRTPYTLGSELMNAETSAWGRAIIAVLASDSKRGIASRQEVKGRVPVTGAEHERLRNGTVELTPDDRPLDRRSAVADDPWTDQPGGTFEHGHVPPEEAPGSIDGRQRSMIFARLTELGVKDQRRRHAEVAGIVGHPVESMNDLSQVEAGRVLAVLHERAGAAVQA